MNGLSNRTVTAGSKVRWIVNGVSGDWERGWSSPLASNRYRAIYPAIALRKAGCDVDLVAMDSWRADPSDTSCVYAIGKLLPGRDVDEFRRASQVLLQQVAAAQAAGARVVADFNDDHFEHPLLGEHWRELAQGATLCTAGSEAMRQAVARYSSRPCLVIGDPIGSPRGEPKVFHTPSGPSKWIQAMLPGATAARLKLCWYGNLSNWRSLQSWADQLAPLARQQPFLLWIVTQPDPSVISFVEGFNARHAPAALAELIPWDEDTQWRTVADADIVLLPSDLADPRKSVKTSNRLADALHAGRYVLASPVPAYLPYVDAVALTEDPLSAAQRYLADPGAARSAIERGQALVEQLHGDEAMVHAWNAALFADVPAASTAPAWSSEQTPAAPVTSLKRLNLGCGDKILPGYVNVDVVASRAGKQPDVICDLRDLQPFASDSVDEVLAVHVVEHFWRWEVEDVLREWVRVLKPGGRMVLECPNLQSACEAFLANPDAGSQSTQAGQRTMWVFYGDPQWKDPLMVHRWGYTPKSLASLMQSVGLVGAKQEPAVYKLREPRDMRVVAYKP